MKRRLSIGFIGFIVLLVLAMSASMSMGTITPNPPCWVQYNGNGTQTTFPYTWKIYANTDLKVIVTGTTGTSVKTLTTDYSVTGVGSSSFGNVVFVTPPAASDVITIALNFSLKQDLHYIPNAPFPAASSETALDRLAMEIRQYTARTFMLDPDQTLRDLTFPSPGVSSVIGWNAAGTALQTYPTTSVAVPNIDYLGNYSNSLATAVSTIGSAPTLLMVTQGTTVSANLTVPSNITLWPTPAGVITINTGVTLTLEGPIQAGLYQIFSCVGSGKPSISRENCQEIYPQWFGAKGDGTTDDTSALNSMVSAAPDGGMIRLVGTFKTTGLLVQKNLSIMSYAPMLYSTQSPGGGFKAAGAQAYVLKFLGVYAADASTFLHVKMDGISIDGDNKAISDAGLVMDTCHLTFMDKVSVQNCAGTGARFRTMWELYISDCFIHNCGALDTGHAVYFDGPAVFDATKGCNNVTIKRCAWSSNKGRWLDVDTLSNMDAFWFEGNKVELDNLTILNTVNTNVLHFGCLSRGTISDNKFASFGTSYGKYTNLIYIGGDLLASPGAPGNKVTGNTYYGQSGSGAINGLYLDTVALGTYEDNNQSVSNSSPVTILPNVNVSEYPQFINRAWRGFSTSAYTYFPAPNRESNGFVSVHRLSHSNVSPKYYADSGSANNSMTVLKLTAADQVNAELCQQYDLSQYVGNASRNIVVKVRMKLTAAGSVTVATNAVAPSWYGAFYVVDSTDWKWYEFTVPVSYLSTSHYLDIYYWQLNSGPTNLLVDGIEISESNEVSEFVTTSTALTVGSISMIDSSLGALTDTLANGAFRGQRHIVTMIDATNPSTVEVATHETSTPEVFTFGVLGATLVLEWDGSKWITISNHGATT